MGLSTLSACSGYWSSLSLIEHLLEKTSLNSFELAHYHILGTKKACFMTSMNKALSNKGTSEVKEWNWAGIDYEYHLYMASLIWLASVPSVSTEA